MYSTNDTFDKFSVTLKLILLSFGNIEVYLDTIWNAAPYVFHQYMECV